MSRPPFSHAQVRAAQMAQVIERALYAAVRDGTPAEAALAFSMLALKFDTVLKFDPKNPRAVRDLLIVACGGSPPGDAMLRALQPQPGESSPVPTEEKLQ